jgi:hypothetical protein
MKKKKTSLYPKTAREALKEWDSGEYVFTVEMGGLGPGYEQVIHIACFELIRDNLGLKLPSAKTPEKWYPNWGDKTFKRIKLGMSGAQAGAAKSMAYKYLKYGYAHMIEKAPEDRRIQVSKYFPASFMKKGKR